MPTTRASRRPQLARTNTWPPNIWIKPDGSAANKTEPKSLSAAFKNKSGFDHFQDDLEDHPEDHYLSPDMAYDDWDDESDDDGEAFEWNAGITDFALFDNDRRRAQEEHDSLPSKWDDFMASQESALRRSEQRTRSYSMPDTTKPPLPVEDVPGLTPDHSPNLRDELDVESFHGQSAPRPAVPSYLTAIVTPPEGDDDRLLESDEDLPLSFYVKRSGQLRQERRKLQRPGLQYSRTLSGKVHVWRRPSWYLYSVGEDAEAERKAEDGVAKVQLDAAEKR